MYKIRNKEILEKLGVASNTDVALNNGWMVFDIGSFRAWCDIQVTLSLTTLIIRDRMVIYRIYNDICAIAPTYNKEINRKVIMIYYAYYC